MEIIQFRFFNGRVIVGFSLTHRKIERNESKNENEKENII